jgi:hypothetical protein
MLHPGVHNAAAGGGAAATIEAANRAYLEAYRRNAKLMRLLEQVATIDDGFRELRRSRAMAFAERNARSIRRLQREGKADPSLDPMLASLALSSMVSRTAYAAFCVGYPAEVDFETLVTTLTRLWTNALRIS